MMNRRAVLKAFAAISVLGRTVWARASTGERLAAAARAQVGVTTGYDPRWTRIAYPKGDVPRSTGVCADVVIRAARDGLGLDLQQLVHEDMVKSFDAYPARRTWGSRQPDPNVDHRRVLNLQAYFLRCGACVWRGSDSIAGDAFPRPLENGDIVTWLLDARLPHIAIVVNGAHGDSFRNPATRVVHNIGRGVEESVLADFHSHLAAGHYRWPMDS